MQPQENSVGMSLIVLASPEPSSFATALARTAADTLEAAGWSVTSLDLYAEGFDPVLSERDFTDRVISERLQPMDEQLHAADSGTFDPALARHVRLFLDADLLLLVCPMWWFSLPAMLKGWIDRCSETALPTAIRTWSRGPATWARSAAC
jgi:NAD(P)H dehydrogenase (quinone)